MVERHLTPEEFVRLLDTYAKWGPQFKEGNPLKERLVAVYDKEAGAADRSGRDAMSGGPAGSEP